MLEGDKEGMLVMVHEPADRDGTGQLGDTHAAVLSCPVDHRLVVGRIPFEYERAAEQGHLFFPG